tara:strand:- start:3504 stop:3863 length:360 start_codon:yes stop_codon:yes gene_type:complete
MAATIRPGNLNFYYSGSSVIPLTAPIFTDSLLVTTFSSGWVLQPSAVNGLDGSPTYTLQVSVTGDANDFVDYRPSFYKKIAITESMSGDTILKGLFLRVSIDNVDNTAGDCELIIKGIS